MKIKSLIISNFLVIANAEINLDNRGLVLVSGINLDDSSANSNGAGKSSIVDAISWCLYGETARGISGDAVINNSVGKDCSVKIIIEDAGVEYTVQRGRKDKALKNGLCVTGYEIGSSSILEMTKGTDKLTQELVNKIVGCSYEVFVAAVYSGQEMMPNLPQMTDKQLKLIVEEAAGIERLEAAYNIANLKLKVAQSKVDDVEWRIRTNKALLETNKDEIDKLIEKKTLWLSDRRIEKEGLASQFNAKIKEFEKIPKCLSIPAKTGLKLEIGGIDRRLAESQGEEKSTLAFLDDQVKIHEKRLWEWELDVKSAMQQAKNLKLMLDMVAERVGKPCDECGKAYCEDDIHDARINAQNKLKTKLLELKSYKNHEEIAKSKLNIALETRKKFVDNMTDVSELLKRQRDIRHLLADSEKLETGKEILAAEIAALQFSIEKLELSNNPFSELLLERKNTKTLLTEQKESLTAELLVAQETVDTCKAAVDVFGRAGVRAHILDTVTPFLNERTAEYLSTLTDGNIVASWSTLGKTAKGELREKFGIAVSKINGSDSFAGLSGGEKRKVRLSTALALQDLVASRATKPIEFCFYDEVDDALDISGLERLMTILESKAKAVGTVLVISHNALEIANVMTVTNVGGVSTVSEF